MDSVVNKLILIILIVIILSCQNKMTFKLNQDEIPDKPLTLTMTNDHDLWPVLTILINGKKVRLHLDTGGEADAISLTKEQIEKILLIKLDKTKSTMMASGKKRTLHYYIANVVEIDSVRFTNCEIMEMPLQDDKFDNIGLIGWGFLRYFTVFIDFQKDLLELYPAGYTDPSEDNNWHTINLDKNNRFKVRLTGFDKVFTAGFDTGALYVNGEKGFNWIRVDQKEFQKRFNSRVEFGYQVITSNVITMDNVKIEDQNFLIYETSEPDDADLFLGYDFFSKHKVLIDYAASKMYFR